MTAAVKSVSGSLAKEQVLVTANKVEAGRTARVIHMCHIHIAKYIFPFNEVCGNRTDYQSHECEYSRLS